MRPEQLPLPSSTSALMADQIIVEAGTGKKTLVGLFSCINLSNLPAKRQINAYFELTDACGEYDFDLQLCRLDSGDCVSSGKLAGVTFPGRLASVEVIVRIPVCFTAYGVYELRMSYRGHVFASRVLHVEPSVSSSSGVAPGVITPESGN